MTNVDHELRNTKFPLIMIGLRKQTHHWLNKAKHSHIIRWLRNNLVFTLTGFQTEDMDLSVRENPGDRSS